MAAARKLGHHPFSTPRAILSRPYQGRLGCTYCGFCQAFGCHVGAKSSILVTKLPEADATGNFQLLTGAMCYRVNSDNSGRVTVLLGSYGFLNSRVVEQNYFAVAQVEPAARKQH